MTEISLTIEWSVWLPIIISGVSLLITVRSMRKRASREKIVDVEQKVDKALKMLKDCEEEVKAIGREKDELRREKFELLERLAKISRANGGTGG